MLLIDATCWPADIKYQTDIGILNEAREKTEEIIDSLHKTRIPQVDSRDEIIHLYYFFSP